MDSTASREGDDPTVAISQKKATKAAPFDYRKFPMDPPAPISGSGSTVAQRPPTEEDQIIAAMKGWKVFAFFVIVAVAAVIIGVATGSIPWSW